MARERLPMRKIREILRLRWTLERSVRDVARSTGVSTGVVTKMTARALKAGLDWSAVEERSDQELEELLYSRPALPTTGRPEPDPLWMDRELRRPGVTLELLHLEYLKAHPEGYRYTAFCDRYRRWKKRQGPVLRQTHKAGETLFVDFSGKRPQVTDPVTGVAEYVELFVAVLGASNYTYAEATRTQRIEDWCGAHMRAFAYFGGAPAVLVPDQLKSGVVHADRYEPGIQRTYADLARHYGCAVVPARPRKPRDKGKVEAGVLIVQRWVLARLRHETFFSLAALNRRIRELVDELNERPMKRLGGVCRRALFEELDGPALRTLPDRTFEVSDWTRAKVSLDYHIDVERHWYSVPHSLVGEVLEVRLTARTVEAFLRGRCVARHVRSPLQHRYTTEPAHRPPNHRAWVESDPGALLSWAKGVGPHAETLMRRLLDPESNFQRQARWRSGCGLRRVGEKHGPTRTEVACAMALRFGARSYKPVARILKLGLDERETAEATLETPPIEHGQVRGPDYYQ